MVNIPDQFDLDVRRAKRQSDPEQQMELLLGALLARKEWYFYNIGTQEKPEPARVEIEDRPYLLVFSSADKLHNLRDLQQGDRKDAEPSPVMSTELPNFSIPCMQAVDYCLALADAQLGGDQSAALLEGMLINPGDHAFAISMASFRHYMAAWKERGGHIGQGFLIPNISTEEDDFYQEHGL
ncbi:MAG TPA: hypothetical protein VK970_13815 [Candidatus Methylacidiphilales bacterium]|nr:hypothetical protein [Candidatus Methylacidiphilales bacterium]